MQCSVQKAGLMQQQNYGKYMAEVWELCMPMASTGERSHAPLVRCVVGDQIARLFQQRKHGEDGVTVQMHALQ